MRLNPKKCHLLRKQMLFLSVVRGWPLTRQRFSPDLGSLQNPIATRAGTLSPGCLARCADGWG